MTTKSAQRASSEETGGERADDERELVAVLTPIFRKEGDGDEEIALRHLEHCLGDHDRYFFVPESLNAERAGFEVVRFPDRYFTNVAAYSRLLLSPEFYRAFRRYEFVLIYQLDCLVFSGDLPAWCLAGWDYVGAPWLNDPQRPEKGFSRVGNGGLSLRRVKTCLRVLESERYVEEPVPFLADLLHAPLPDLGRRWSPGTLRRRIRVLREVRRGVAWYASHYTLNEDRFWSDRARLFLPEFRIPPPEVAMDFAFERAPRYCYERNGRRLPFGCHAWNRWDRRFWEPFLLAPAETPL